MNNSVISEMDESSDISNRIRWLTVAVGISAAGLFFFLSPLAALGPTLPAAGAALQPRLPLTIRRVVKWLIWAWAFGWSPGSIFIALLLLRNVPHDHRSAWLVVVFSSVSALFVLWWDLELIADAATRARRWRSEPSNRQQTVGWSVWLFAVLANLWIGWGLARMWGVYQGLSDLYTVAILAAEALAVLVFDLWLIIRIARFKSTRGSAPKI